MPHVVKFSGGRSSGMLLFTLLENGILIPERGDVIIFNNTSAEHPNTYRFVRDCIQASKSYGIPFFQIEFQTYEDARRGEWVRLPTYRLVNDRPKSESNSNGYHWRGEVFEELLSWAGYVPNQFNRICTRHLKLDVTRNFLKDWFAVKPEISRLGHFGSLPRIDPNESFERHKANNGGVPKSIYLRKREFVWSRPHYRPAQKYESFCSIWTPTNNPNLKRKAIGDRVALGKNGVEYLAFIGLRNDEPHRVRRVEERNNTSKGFEGEHVYTPLNDMAVSRSDVNRFWRFQSSDWTQLEDTTISNCVYCFLKGTANLHAVHSKLATETGIKDGEFGSWRESPCDLEWWIRMESDYGRDLLAEDREIRSGIKHIGFFGSGGFDYSSINNVKNDVAFGESALPCDCTE